MSTKYKSKLLIQYTPETYPIICKLVNKSEYQHKLTA